MEEKQHDIIEVCRRRKEEFRLPLPVDGWERLEADGGCGKCRRLNRCRKKS